MHQNTSNLQPQSQSAGLPSSSSPQAFAEWRGTVKPEGGVSSGKTKGIPSGHSGRSASAPRWPLPNLRGGLWDRETRDTFGHHLRHYFYLEVTQIPEGLQTLYKEEKIGPRLESL